MTTRYTLVCSAPGHAGRSAQPGWAATLGFVDLPDDRDPTPALRGALCVACARVAAAAARVAEADRRATLEEVAGTGATELDDDRLLLVLRGLVRRVLALEADVTALKARTP